MQKSPETLVCHGFTAKTPRRPRGEKAVGPFSAWILNLDISNLTALTSPYASPYGQGPQKTQCLCGSLRVYGSEAPWRSTCRSCRASTRTQSNQIKADQTQ